MTQLYGDYVRDTYLIPVVKDKAAAPDKILKLISCGCKQGCTDKICVCVKAVMSCTILFSGCNGRDCTNVENVIEPDETDWCLMLSYDAMLSFIWIKTHLSILLSSSKFFSTTATV